VYFAVAGVVFYNTKILNSVDTDDDNNRTVANYEKTYRRYDNLPQPRVISARYTIDLDPAHRSMKAHVEEVIQNKTAQPISVLHFNFDEGTTDDMEVPGGKSIQDDDKLGYQIFSLSPPMMPGESRTLKFELSREPDGWFSNDGSATGVVQNGTFFNNYLVPQIGYQHRLELRDKRWNYGLNEGELPAPERNCTARCGNSYLSNEADWVNVETVISTSPDQVAIAPGSLVREWRADGRRYFQYRLDHASANFFCFQSARYEIAREEWNGVRLEVYYLKDHPWNVARMRESMRKSLAYYIANFGPYPHKQARIIEFPRVASFAQAYPGTMPYSEAVGFIAHIEKPDDVDLVFDVVAHEMAHQWWAHQVAPADVQGAQLLSESLAEYSALMVTEKARGRDAMTKLLRYELEQYLKGRAAEVHQEHSLLTTKAGQEYCYYNKASLAMYYLREMIGEDAVNRALRKVLTQYRYAEPPYPTSYALVDALRDETPPELRYLIRDLFEEITLFDNRVVDATYTKRADGKYDVALDAESHKFRVGRDGTETEMPIDDWVEIGAFTAPPAGGELGKTLFSTKVHLKTNRVKYVFTVEEQPYRAGIDPRLLLIDKSPDNNVQNVTPRQ
jgi:hypothetical protein